MILLISAIVLALGRLLIMIGGAIVHVRGTRKRHARLHRNLRSRGFWPPLSILVPAYNEEPVIADALRSVLRSEYPHFEVVVIDDGSQDNTAREVLKVVQEDPRVRLIIHPKNKGKAAGLNTGLRAARHDVVVTIDADTWLTPRTLKYLALNMLSGDYGAATANIQIGNQQHLLTAWQQIEYVTGIHTERRSLALFGCITTLPGACSAFRRDAVEAVGGWPAGTLAEDTDITLRLLEADYRLAFEPRAVALTEAPSSIRDFYRQRFRWLYGNFQCLGLHMRPVFTTTNLPLKLFGFPNLAISGTLLFLFFPAFVFVTVQTIMNPNVLSMALLPTYFLADIMGSVVAFIIAKERKALLWHALPQRVFYLFFMGLLLIRVVMSSVFRVRPGWGKLSRRGLRDSG